MMTQVRVLGMVRGREIDRQARLSVEDDALLIAWQDATPWRLGFDGIDGFAAGAAGSSRDASLMLYLRDHDILELTGDDELRLLGTRLLDRACRMPELTRGLRGLGAVRTDRALQAMHDRWFGPLLSARRVVQSVTDPVRQVELLDGAKLTDAMTRVISEMATTTSPTDPAEQRALEAALEDEAEPLLSALRAMTIAGELVRVGDADTHLADWRAWVETAKACYAAADEGWGGVVSVIANG
jgi:hypothetical protein